MQWARYEQLWQEGGSGGFLKAFPNILVHPDVNEVCADFVRQKIRETVKDPKTAEALSPSGYPFGVKRLCVDTDYFDTYNRPNVELVNLREEPIEKITADAVDTASRHFELDALVFATGFDAVTGALLAVDIRGRDGATLKDAWSEGPQTYLGLTVAGFPNLFTITGPGSPSVIGNVITNCEYHVDWIAECLTHMRQHNLAHDRARRRGPDRLGRSTSPRSPTARSFPRPTPGTWASTFPASRASSCRISARATARPARRSWPTATGDSASAGRPRHEREAAE